MYIYIYSLILSGFLDGYLSASTTSSAASFTGSTQPSKVTSSSSSIHLQKSQIPLQLDRKPTHSSLQWLLISMMDRKMALIALVPSTRRRGLSANICRTS